MKATNIIALLLLFVIMFQSCVVYQKTPVSNFHDAAGTSKTKAIRSDGKKYKLSFIKELNGVYTGSLRYRSGEIQLDPNDYQIYLKDRKKSKTRTTILALTGGTILAVGVGFLIYIIIVFHDY